MQSAIKNQDHIVLDYNDLVADIDLSEYIAQAYGEDGLGLLTVKNVPGLVEARNALLPLSYQLGNLEEGIQERYAISEASYTVGWSKGKEKLEGKPDHLKGSFYCNPAHDKITDDAALLAKYPDFYFPNVWPTAEMPDLEPCLKKLGQLIAKVGVLVSRQCDRYVKNMDANYPEGRMEAIVQNSRCVKARLLHYYPTAQADSDTLAKPEKEEPLTEKSFSNWCGWHNDHSSITGLTAAMFIGEKGEVVPNMDPTSGLYIRNRKSELVKVGIPQDHIAFQIGEAQQIHSGGVLQVRIVDSYVQ
jgi:isopenicillin N synthase-like dioxygenase